MQSESSKQNRNEQKHAAGDCKAAESVSCKNHCHRNREDESADVGGNAENCNSAGAPIYNSAGKIIAAINIVLPSFRFTGENRIKIIRLAMAGAAELSAANKK